MARVMSDAEIRRRKALQGKISETTGALGLTALGGTLLATKGGSKATKAAFKVAGRERPGFLKPKNLRRHTAPILATSAGIGGAGSFNFAAYTNAESRKRRAMVQKNDDAPYMGEEGIAKRYEEEISKIGDWKTIDQREQVQRRQRKAMRGAGAAAGVGAGLVTLGYHDSGDRPKYKAGVGTLRQIKGMHAAKEMSNKDALKAAGRTARTVGGELSASGKIGVGMLGGAALVGGAAKGRHTYEQHKINQRRRQNFRKDWSPTARNYDPEANRGRRSKAYEVGGGAIAGAAGVSAAGLGGNAVIAGRRAAKLGEVAAQAKRQKKAYAGTARQAGKLASQAAKSKKAALVLTPIAAGAAGLSAGARRGNRNSWKSY